MMKSALLVGFGLITTLSTNTFAQLDAISDHELSSMYGSVSLNINEAGFDKPLATSLSDPEPQARTIVRNSDQQRQILQVNNSEIANKVLNSSLLKIGNGLLGNMQAEFTKVNMNATVTVLTQSTNLLTALESK